MRNFAMHTSVVPGGFTLVDKGTNGENIFSDSTGGVYFAEVEDALIITVDVPGFSKEDVNVSIDRSVIKVKGTCDSIAGSKREIKSSFSLSELALRDFDITNMSAVCSKGILTITVPKKESSKKRDIEIS